MYLYDETIPFRSFLTLSLFSNYSSLFRYVLSLFHFLSMLYLRLSSIRFCFKVSPAFFFNVSTAFYLSPAFRSILSPIFSTENKEHPLIPFLKTRHESLPSGCSVQAFFPRSPNLSFNPPHPLENTCTEILAFLKLSDTTQPLLWHELSSHYTKCRQLLTFILSFFMTSVTFSK